MSSRRLVTATPSGVVGMIRRAPVQVALLLGASLWCFVPSAGAIDQGPSLTKVKAPKGERLAAEKKERVPKTPSPPETKRTKGSGPAVQDDDDDDDGDCFMDCLFGLFSSSDSQTPVLDPATAASPAVGMAPVVWHVGDLAIVPSGIMGGAIPVWSGPGGEAEGWDELGMLPANTRIRVLETHSLASGDWLRVTNDDGSGPAGWVAAHLITAPPPPPGPPPPPPRWPEDRAPGASPRSMLTLSAGTAWFVGPQEVQDEYVNPLFRVGLGGKWRVAPGFMVGVAAGYGGATGHPKFDYVTSTGFDSPQSSAIHVTDLGLQVGDFVPLGSGKTTWFWGLGPGGYWVYESAKIDYEVLQFPGPVVVDSGSRTESLSRLRFGGEVVTGMMWWTGNRGGTDNLGFIVRGFAIAWSSDQAKSLTFDWIGDQTPVGVEIALVYGHAAY
jgi:hypothetical protein